MSESKEDGGAAFPFLNERDPKEMAEAIAKYKAENAKLWAALHSIKLAYAGDEDAPGAAHTIPASEVVLWIDGAKIALKHMLGAIDSGGIDSEEIPGNERDSIPPHKWHEEWAAHARRLV